MNVIRIAADVETRVTGALTWVAASLPATLELVADNADVRAVSGAAGWVERANQALREGASGVVVVAPEAEAIDGLRNTAAERNAFVILDQRWRSNPAVIAARDAVSNLDAPISFAEIAVNVPATEDVERAMHESVQIAHHVIGAVENLRILHRQSRTVLVSGTVGGGAPLTISIAVGPGNRPSLPRPSRRSIRRSASVRAGSRNGGTRARHHPACRRVDHAARPLGVCPPCLVAARDHRLRTRRTSRRPARVRRGEPAALQPSLPLVASRHPVHPTANPFHSPHSPHPTHHREPTARSGRSPMMNTSTPATFSRRGFLGIAAAAAAVPLLAACAPGGGGGGATGGGSGTLKFWDMPWGPQAYADEAKAVVTGYSPASGLPSASYQQIQWNNFYQTFSSAIASKTGPAVSSGAGFQAFQFAEQGAIAYADDLIDSLRKSGKLDDFLPGTVESMKTPDGYAAVPWQADYRVLWYRKSLLEQAGVEVPTDWASYIEASKALAKNGVYGFGIGAGAGNSVGSQTLLSLMVNNGGGLFDKDQNPDAVTDANIEAMDFVRELIALGAVDPGAASYTADNVFEQWTNKTRRHGLAHRRPAARPR